MSRALTRKKKWWESAVFYEVFLRSFCDGNADGIGDLPGLIRRLDYLQELGIDALYLSSHYPSPFRDGGFDITDFRGVDPAYGTLEDFKRLLDEVHDRGMYLVIDFVLNHTSDQHPWFQESRSSLGNPKQDWYVWQPPVEGGPPNNWQSVFHHSAWEFDSQAGRYYYHFFLKEQPDLNWRNPEVQEAMLGCMRFWLDLGVDGFRLDAVGTVFESPALEDFPAEYTLSLEEQVQELRASFPKPPGIEILAYLGFKREQMFKYQWEQPETHALMSVFRSLVDEYGDRVLLGETDRCVYYGNGTDRLHLIFNFPLFESSSLNPPWVRLNQRDRAAQMPPGAWPCNTLGNHDTSRVYTRYANGEHDEQLTRLHTALLLTLRGTPFLYYGDEIGMRDLDLRGVEQFRDVQGILAYRVMTGTFRVPDEEALALSNFLCRDKCRAPMQWDESANGGFCPDGVEPWLPVHPSYAREVNVTRQLEDAGSLLSFVRRLLRVRRQTPALQVGTYESVEPESKEYLAFWRSHEGQRCLVVLNMSDGEQALQVEHGAARMDVLFSSEPGGPVERNARHLVLEPFEILILE